MCMSFKIGMSRVKFHAVSGSGGSGLLAVYRKSCRVCVSFAGAFPDAMNRILSINSCNDAAQQTYHHVHYFWREPWGDRTASIVDREITDR